LWPARSSRQPAAAPRARETDTELPARWLLAEWPQGAEEPVKYWLSNLPADTPLARLGGLAKIRWRIEHDYRELKDALGLDHFDGRSYRGWHHHVTLVSVAHAFLILERRRPRLRAAA
jgi:SRSO17 transposase